jgi:hypothetical protein
MAVYEEFTASVNDRAGCATEDTDGEFSLGAESVPRAVASVVPEVGLLRKRRSLPLAVLICRQNTESRLRPTFDHCSCATCYARMSLARVSAL